MVDNIIKINERIARARNKLHRSIVRKLSADVIYQNSVDLDILISEYYKCKQQQEFLEKYDNLINKSFKNEILKSIKQEVKENIKDMSNIELEYYCNNLYLYACLKANNISDNEITKILSYKNIIIAQNLEKANLKCSNIPIEFNNNISNKYCKILKNRCSNEN